MKTHSKLFSMAAVAATVLMAAGSALAGPPGRGDYDDRGGNRGDHEGRGPDRHYDDRYSHNHYYPSRGYVVHDLPRGRYVVGDRYRHRFFFSGGVFYSASGPGFVVIAPPLGVFVPVLPGFYTTLWFGGVPYYYANDAYYVWRPAARAYEVVDAPEGASASTSSDSSAPTTVASDIFVYPKNGQNEEQTARDKYECHRWAASETGFDPTVSGGGVPAEQNGSKRADYQRAMAACLEGRGYSVK